MRRGAALAHLREHGARHQVARRALGLRVVARHEALFRSVEQIAAGAAQAFLEHRAGHARMRAGEQARWDGTAPSPCRAAAAPRAAPSRGRRSSCRPRACGTVHRRAAAGREQHGLRAHEDVFAGAHVDEEHAGDAIFRSRAFMSSTARCSSRRADAARPHLLGEAVDDLDAGEVALVHGAVEGLAGERLLVDGAVGLRSKKQPSSFSSSRILSTAR